MAQVRPLRLKSQKSSAKPEVSAHAPVAQVLVDTPVFHLNVPYDYLVKQTDDQKVQVGALVKVNFSGRETKGYVISRREFATSSEPIAKLKYIESIVSPLSVLTEAMHALLIQVAKRYGSTVNELLPAAIPDRSAAGERLFNPKKPIGILNTNLSTTSMKPRKSFTSDESEILRSKEHLSLSVFLSMGTNAYQAIAEIVQLRADLSPILIVVPDRKDLDLLTTQLFDFTGNIPIELGTHQSKSQRYLNFLQANLCPTQIIVGTRSAIFTNLPPKSTIVILDDSDESMYDKRAPGWNVRDVALLRSQQHSIIFVSHYPSFEISRLVEMGWMSSIATKGQARMKISAQEENGSFQQTIHSGLRSGSVLVTTSNPGYVSSFLCQKCRNSALCSCGGKLAIPSIKDSPTCSLCARTYLDWSCTWCGSSFIRMLGRGVARKAEEFGKTFPGVQVVTSTSAHRIDIKPEGRVLVISTLGCEPEGEYTAVVLLDGEINFNRVELRSEEGALSRWLRAASLANRAGEIFISLNSQHPIAQAFAARNFTRLTKRLLEQRAEAHLPPFFRIATILGNPLELTGIVDSLVEKTHFEVLGPIPIDQSESKLIIRVPVENGQELSDFILDLRRLRSIKAQTPLTIRIDPYAI